MYFSALLSLFIVVPALELMVLFRAKDVIGLGNTFVLIIATGFIGAGLARWQGLQTVSLIYKDMSEGRMPAPRLFDAMLIVVAGALLVTPGFITDTVGFMLLIPFFRDLIKRWIRKKIEDRMKDNTVNVTYWEK